MRYLFPGLIIFISLIQVKGSIDNVKTERFNDFMNSIVEHNLDEIYKYIDKDIKEVQSKENVLKLFNLYHKYYGKIVAYNVTSSDLIKDEDNSFYATVLYHVDFENYSGKLKCVYKLYNEKFKVYIYSLSLDNYSEVEFFNRISKDTFKALEKQDKEDILRLAHGELKDQLLISDKPLKKFFAIDFEGKKMIQNQFWLKGENEIIVVYYEIHNKEGYLKLAYSLNEQDIHLIGMYYAVNFSELMNNQIEI